ncbi:MAG: LysR family transcriptional regulator [Lachnospiraceae bacterium]|nr:LysR family transcriptional regulator [Lachnospiraceae bacterium]
MLDAKLETLLAVYEEKSFTKAANKLSVTQQTVSNQINMLEQQLNCTLCARVKGQLVFTAEGEIAINYAKRFKAVYARMREEIDENKSVPTHIKIGMTRAVESDSIVASAISQYISCNAGINITIFANTLKKLYEMLENFELDIIIIDSKPEYPFFASRLLDSDNVLCIIGNNNPLSHKTSVSLEDLKNERFIMRPPSSATRAIFEAALNSIHESINNLNVVLEVDSKTTIKLLVMNGVGISIMSKRNCLHDLNNHTFVGLPIEDLNIKRELYLVYRKDFPHTTLLDNLQHIYNISDYT